MSSSRQWSPKRDSDKLEQVYQDGDESGNQKLWDTVIEIEYVWLTEKMFEGTYVGGEQFFLLVQKVGSELIG